MSPVNLTNEKVFVRSWLKAAKPCPKCGPPGIDQADYGFFYMLGCAHFRAQIRDLNPSPADARIDDEYAKKKAIVDHLIEDWNKQVDNAQK